ncbi:26S proteasome complex subunit Sem1p [[Candida] anglica]|uniref:26S proteasome complex subunit SEM1 n=1 Tax=[Candida] anglica TaxID=148631 RepID=A0ABP0EBF1_9ASCO
MSAKEAQPTTAPVSAEDEPKVIKTLEEDDEFEDFPDDTKWSKEARTTNPQLWEEDWDDEDSNDAFSQQLREELKKNQKSA